MVNDDSEDDLSDTEEEAIRAERSESKPTLPYIEAKYGKLD